MAPYSHMGRLDREKPLRWAVGTIGKIEESYLEFSLISSKSLEGGIRSTRMSFKSHSLKSIIKMPTICSMRGMQSHPSTVGPKYALNNEDNLYGRWRIQYTNEKRGRPFSNQRAIGFKLSYDGQLYEESQCDESQSGLKPISLHFYAQH